MTVRALTISARSYSGIASTPGDWRIEKLQDDGEIHVSIVGGGDARQRAIRYASREYGAHEEIELEPYARAD